MSSSLYEDVLLGALLAQKQLIIPEKYISLEKIDNSAEKIGKKIDEEADISEAATFLVFMDIEADQDVSKEAMRAYAAADELLLSAKADSGLVWKLCEMGKQPQKLLFVFAERVARGRSIQENLMNSRIWFDFGLPDWQEVKNQLLNISEQDDDQNTIAEKIEQYIIEKAAQDRIINDQIVCWKPIIHSFCNHIVATGIDVGQWNDKLWYSNFRSALNNYIQTVLRDTIQNKYAFSIEYWYQTWEERDSKEKNRSECQMMLFLYSITYDGMQERDNPLITIRPGVNQTPAKACPIPAINMSNFGEVLAEHYQQCLLKEYKEADVPKRIHEELAQRELSQRALIKSEYKAPDLIPEELLEMGSFKANSRISLKQVISILTQSEQYGLNGVQSSERGLSNQIQRVFSLIRQHCKDNHDKIEEYISRISSEYNRIKDECMEKMPFTAEDCPDFTEGGETTQSNKMQDELENVERNVDRLIAEAEKKLLQPISDIPKPITMDKEIEKAEAKTTYYLECLKNRMIHLVFWVLFVLAIIIPYYVTKTQVHKTIPGFLFLIVTGAVTVLALLVGYVIFYNQYHIKVLKVMEELIFSFINSQKENKECIKNYKDLLYKRIPRCYGLHRYRNMLLEYKKESRLWRLKITYHETAKDRWRKGIVKLIDNLDIGEDVLNREPRVPLKIDPDKDCAGNEEVYILSSDEVRSTLVQGGVR